MRSSRSSFARHILVLALVPAALSCTKPAVKEPVPNSGRTYTYKALAGISMGGIGANFLTGYGENHKKLDAVAGLGGPVDAAYFLGGFERMQISGFCPIEKLEAALARDPNALNNPNDPDLKDCQKPNAPFEYEHPQDFNHWQFTTSGGTFDRSSYLDIFHDLSLALGNPLYHNPESALFPGKGINRQTFKPEICEPGKAIVFKGENAMYNKEYNPEGKYQVITFCDGEEPILYCDDANKTPMDWCQELSPDDFCKGLGGTKALEAGKSSDRNADLYFKKKGEYEVCYKHTDPSPFAVAVDINGNGQRDYHEPIVINAHERYGDTGPDGCLNDKEDGKGGCTASGQTGDPNGDDFSPNKNPLGLQGNFVRDENETYEDNGLDGVAGTKDFGEANGQYDDSPNRAHWLKSDLRQSYGKWSEQERKNLDIYADGGVRDVFNLGLSGDILTSVVRALEPNDSKRYTHFEQLKPLEAPSWDLVGGFKPLEADYSVLGRNVFMLYGKDTVSTSEWRNGDGDHVGTAGQVLDRFQTFIKWMSHHWEGTLGEPYAAGAVPKRDGVVYYSDKLKGLRNFDIVLPVGYEDPANAEKRYPVFFLGHGYGMDAEGMGNVSLIFNSFAEAGYILPMITVYPSGRCCYVKPDGTKDCRDVEEVIDDKGVKRLVEIDKLHPDYRRECIKGNFYVNRQGFVPGDETPYGDAVFEIMDYVDKNYRTLAPVTLEATP